MYILFLSKLKSKWLRNLLLISMIFYLFPLPIFKYYFRDLFHSLGLTSTYLINTVKGKINKNNIYVKFNNEYVFSSLEISFFIFMFVMALLSITFIAYNIWQYIYLRRNTQNCLQITLTKQENRILNLLKSNMKIKREILLIKTPTVSLPFTMGIISPIIVLPANLPKTKNSFYMALKHELVHIKHNDALLSIIACFILAIHWFNPLSYLFLFCLKIANELYYDEVTTKSMNKNEKKEYCTLLVELSKRDGFNKNFFTFNFIGSAKWQLKRRIDNIMATKKANFNIAIILGGILLYCGVYSTFIHTDSEHLYIESDDRFSFESEESFYNFSTELSKNKLPFHEYFIDKHNNVFLIENRQSIIQIICKHDYESGTEKIHKKAEEQCTIDYYHAKRCTKCGKILRNNIYSTRTWKVCPHKLNTNKKKHSSL